MNSRTELIQLNSDTDLSSALGMKLWNLCRAAGQDGSSAARNLQTDDWQSRPETLLYCLYIEKRFDSPQGQFYAVLDMNEIVAVGGIYRSEFCPDHIAVAAVRTYTVAHRRNQFWHGEYLIPQQIKWAQAENMSQVIFSINPENEILIKFLTRASQKRAGVLGKSYPEIYRQLQKHPKPILLKNTVQHIFKLNLNTHFEWNYRSLESENA